MTADLSPPQAPAGGPRGLGRLLVSAADPEWVLGLIVLLMPCVLTAGVGQFQKSAFFLGAAVYVSVLKWLGWMVFGRFSPARPRWLLFPAEVFAGLAVACGWFYLRNGLAVIWPASYSLRELSLLFPMLLVVHLTALAVQAPDLLGIVRDAGREVAAGVGHRLAFIGPFVVLLTVALWTMSGELGVQSTDPLFYAFSARVYLRDGLFFAVPPAGRPLVYPSGLGAMNAVASAVAPLSVVQAVHLQHVLLCVLGLFLITGTVAVLAGRPLPLLHSLPAPFLALFPLYALYPDILYPGAPRQAGPPLFAAITLLPLLAPAGRRPSVLLSLAVCALLPPLAALLNPACVPYAALATAVALAINAWRARAVPRWWGRLIGLQVVLTLLAAGLLLGNDLYYRDLVRRAVWPETAAKPEDAQPGTTRGSRPPVFSIAQAQQVVASTRPFHLSIHVTSTSCSPPFDGLRGWTERWPQRAIAWLGLGLAAVAIPGGLRRRRLAIGTPALAILLAAGLVLWFGVKYAAAFLAGGLTLDDWVVQILHSYLRYLALRCELLLLFTCLAAAPVVLLGMGRRLPTEARWAGTALALAGCWLVLVMVLVSGTAVSGPVVIPRTSATRQNGVIVPQTPPFRVTADDLRLVAWLDENVPPEKGWIGLAAWTYGVGPGRSEKHLYALGGGQALPLYARHDNYRFALAWLEPNGIADYEAYVRDRFDAEWCLRNGIRYFYVPDEALEDNPGIAQAIAHGELREIHRAGAAAVYLVVAPKAW